MAYQITWFVPKRIVLLKYQGELTEDELYASDAELCHFYDNGDADVEHIHQICVFEAKSKNSSLSVLMSMKWPRHPRNGWMIGVGKPNSIERILGGFAAQLFKIHFRSFENIAQAVDFLYRIDPTLPAESSPDAILLQAGD